MIPRPGMLISGHAARVKQAVYLTLHPIVLKSRTNG